MGKQSQATRHNAVVRSCSPHSAPSSETRLVSYGKPPIPKRMPQLLECDGVWRLPNDMDPDPSQSSSDTLGKRQSYLEKLAKGIISFFLWCLLIAYCVGGVFGSIVYLGFEGQLKTASLRCGVSHRPKWARFG